MTRLAGTAGIAALVLLLLSGCWSSGHHPDTSITSAELAGTWSSPTLSVVFEEDGTFTAPTEFCGLFNFGPTAFPTPNGPTEITSGTWQFDNDHYDDLDHHSIRLTWSQESADGERVSGCNEPLELEYLDGEVKLFTWIGDPDADETVTFTRTPPLVPTTAP